MWSIFQPQSGRTNPSTRPSLFLFFCLVGSFLLALVPHVQQLPLWVSVGVGVAMVIRSIGEIRRWRLPSPTICGLVAICLLAGIYRQFDTVGGRDAGTAFMAGLLAIKFFEWRGPRDVALIIFSSFFVVMSSLLYSQAIELFIYCLIMMWVLTALLIRTSMGDQPEDRLLRMLRVSATVFLQALPLTLFLFFFFPRYHGVLQLGMDDSSIGLTDKIEPGSISRLADDDSTAMTVKITGDDVTTTDKMYWRAIVLWGYNHEIWTPGNGAFAPQKPNEGLPRAIPGQRLIDQEITIWPHLHKWLFALDHPIDLAAPDPNAGSADWSSEALNGGVLQIKEPGMVLTRKERYTVSSAPEVEEPEMSEELLKVALDLPHSKDDQIDPRVRALAVKLKEGCRNEDDYILAVLRYFRRENFKYSESPGAGGTLANFLFNTKIGFCEHYASAFGVLMRLGGYPARLVVGYHGGQYNPYDNLYIIKQSNAHSWDEVWIASEKRWRRVDPTSVISNADMLAANPLTREAGAPDESLSIEVAHHRVTFLSSAHIPGWLKRSLLEVQLRRQELESNWDDWVFSYDPQTQIRLAQALGMTGEVRYALGLACLAAIAICAVIFGAIIRRKKAVVPIEAFYTKFCRNLAQRGVPRALWEGPLAYTDRAAEAFPEQREMIRNAGQLVARARYGPGSSTPAHEELNSLLLLITASHASSSSGDSR